MITTKKNTTKKGQEFKIRIVSDALWREEDIIEYLTTDHHDSSPLDGIEEFITVSELNTDRDKMDDIGRLMRECDYKTDIGLKAYNKLCDEYNLLNPRHPMHKL